jgi:hypothetical protein
MVGLLLPWTWRNSRLFHAFLPLTTSAGVNLVGGNNARADGGFVWSGPYVLTGMNEVDSQRQYTTMALDWIKSNPLGVLRLLPAKAARFLWPLSFSISGYLNLPLPAFIAVLSAALLFYGLMAGGMWTLIRTHRPWEATVLAAPFAALLLTSLATYGGTRYSLPAFPGIAVLAGVGIESLWTGRLIRRLRRGPRPLALGSTDGSS